MALSIYVGGVLEVPGDNSGVILGAIGSVATFAIKCAAGDLNADAVTVYAPTDCEVSKDGTTYAKSVTYDSGGITDAGVTVYVKRTAATVSARWTGLVTSPRIADVTAYAWHYAFDSGTSGVTKYDGTGVNPLSNTAGYVEYSTAENVSNTGCLRLTGQYLSLASTTNRHFRCRVFNSDLADTTIPFWLGNASYGSYTDITGNFTTTRVFMPLLYPTNHATSPGDFAFAYINNAGGYTNLVAVTEDTIADGGYLDIDIEFDADNVRWRVTLTTATKSVTSAWVAYSATRSFTDLYMYASDSSATANKFRWGATTYSAR